MAQPTIKKAALLRRCDGIPRRIDIQLRFPAEVTISKAIEEVELLGCDERLTDAAVKLDEARALVGDFLDERIVGKQ